MKQPLKKIILSNKREGDFAEIFIAEKFYKVKLKENSKKTLVLSNLDPKIHIKIDKKKIDYLTNRIERSYQFAIKIAKKIDSKSLESHSNISLRFLKKIFRR